LPVCSFSKSKSGVTTIRELWWQSDAKPIDREVWWQEWPETGPNGLSVRFAHSDGAVVSCGTAGHRGPSLCTAKRWNDTPRDEPSLIHCDPNILAAEWIGGVDQRTGIERSGRVEKMVGRS
jgi:hypothetical protein